MSKQTSSFPSSTLTRYGSAESGTGTAVRGGGTPVVAELHGRQRFLCPVWWTLPCSLAWTVLQVYYFSKGTLKIANKQFTAVKNDYEMTFNNETSVMPCEDGRNLPTVQFDFTKIDDLESKPKDSLVGESASESKESADDQFVCRTLDGGRGVRLACLPFSLWSRCYGSLDCPQLKHRACVTDVIGICKSYEDATKITVKANNREVSKRNIYLMDTSGKVVSAALWGEDVSTRVRSQSVCRELAACPGDPS